MLVRRKVLSALVFALLAGLLAAGCGSGGAGGGDAEGGDAGSGGEEPIQIGYINWDEDVAVSNLAKILIEDELGRDVELRLLDVGPLFDGVANGDLDAFLDVWLPTTHEDYWNEYEDQVVDLGRWYEGEASLGLAVPEYAEARSIGDLEEHRDEFGGRIVGIEPGSGIMSAAENAISEYGLDYELLDASTPAMLGEVERALQDDEEIVFTAWKPHWMFTAYDIRYLEDPEGAMGSAEQLSAIAREGLEEDAPEVFELLDNISLSEEQLGELELAIQESGDPLEGTRTWLEENRDVVEPWLPEGS